MRAVSEVFRVASILMFGVLFILNSANFKNNVKEIKLILCFTALFLYGYFLAELNGSGETALLDLLVTLTVVPVCILVIAHERVILGRFESYLLVFIIFLFFLLNVFTGGIILDVPPKYDFSYASEVKGRPIYYGQGVAKFFSLGAIIASIILINEAKRFSKMCMLLAIFLFATLSMMSGARGELIAMIASLIVMLLFNARLSSAIFICILLTGLIAVSYTYMSLGDFLFFQRMSSLLNGSFGARGHLYSDAIILLMENEKCFLIGCGFNFFQNEYSYSLGLYPHNFILEAAIVWGVPIVTILLLLFLIGMLNQAKSRENTDIFFYLTFFFTIIALKSGSVISSHLFLIFFSITAYRGAEVMLNFLTKKGSNGKL